MKDKGDRSTALLLQAKTRAINPFSKIPLNPTGLAIRAALYMGATPENAAKAAHRDDDPDATPYRRQANTMLSKFETPSMETRKIRDQLIGASTGKEMKEILSTLVQLLSAAESGNTEREKHRPKIPPPPPSSAAVAGASKIKV